MDFDEPTEIPLGKDGGISFKDIVMHQFKTIAKLSNIEFRGGFYHTKYIDGVEKEVYVEDTREVYNNSIYTLSLLLKPRFDDVMKKSFSKFLERKKLNEKRFMDKSSIDEEVVLGEGYYPKMEDKVLLETYKMKRLKLHQFLFKELSHFLDRINHLESLGGTFR